MFLFYLDRFVIDPSVPIITKKSDGQPPDRPTSLTQLDIAKLNAAYSCPNKKAGSCYKHIRLTDEDPTALLSSEDGFYNGCQILLSAPGKRIVIEPLIFKVSFNKL